MGSRLHCFSCDVDETDQPCYQACLECRHVWRTAGELLAAHNAQAVQGVRLGNADRRGQGVSRCPKCSHDW